MDAAELRVPLRIPGGWAVTYNSVFADVAPEVRDGSIVNFEYFKEDLLVIRQLRIIAGRHEIDHAGWLLDLGWYPDSDPSGGYTLTLVRGDWEQIVFRVHDRDAQIIRAAIERILDGLTRREELAAVGAAVGASWANGMPGALDPR